MVKPGLSQLFYFFIQGMDEFKVKIGVQDATRVGVKSEQHTFSTDLFRLVNELLQNFLVAQMNPVESACSGYRAVERIKFL